VVLDALSDAASAIGEALGLGGGGGGADPGLPPITKRTIKIAGVELAEALDHQITNVTVVDRLRMPDSFIIVFRDPGQGVLKKARLKIGAKVEISTTSPGSEKVDVLVSGEVTSIEAEYDLLGARAVVRGYDKLHRLAAGRKTKTWTNSTYADVAEEIVSAAGLSVSVGSSGGTLDHVIQGNVSDLDFLYQLAHRVGFDLYINKDTVHFKKPTRASKGPGPGTTTSTNPRQLVWGHNLLEFRARVSAVAQVSDVKVRGWDVKKKNAVIGKAKAQTDSASLSLSPSQLASLVGGESMVVTDRPVVDQSQADNLAKAIADQVASSAYEATAVVVGAPILRAGVAVTVSGVEPALAGDWVISSARHEFASGAYRTHLEFSGRQDRSLHGLMSGGLSVPATRTSIPGVVIGLVTDNDDPDKKGRVKVRYPWLGETAVSFWARIARPSAGKDYGFMWVPEVGEEVVLAFEHGDLSFPLVIGSLWNGKDTLPSKLTNGLIDGGKVVRHAIVSPGGHKIMFYDKSDDAGIMIVTADAKVRIVLGQSDKRMLIYCDGDVKFESTGKMELKAGKEFSIAAEGAIKIEGKQSLDVKSSSSMSVESKAQLTLKGSKVGVN
jgi:uncharacterized protein involved in type VI secretion and phage assembly